MKSTQVPNVYDLQFTLIGQYSSIIDFLYDIEEDEELHFEPKKFTITSDLTSSVPTENKTKNDENKNNINKNVANVQNTVGQKTKNEVNKSENEVNKSKKVTSKQLKNDGINLKATFTVNDVGITLD